MNLNNHVLTIVALPYLIPIWFCHDIPTCLLDAAVFLLSLTTAGHFTGTSEMEKVTIDLQHLYVIDRSTIPSTAPLFVITIPALIKSVCFQIIGFF